MSLRATSEEGLPLRIKLEFNTHETSPARPPIRIPFSVDNSWFTGAADVLTFTTAELVSTKLRALYQRKKGRDLFDLWLALKQTSVRAEEILSCFAPYRPHGYTSASAIANLQAKATDNDFVNDLRPLVASWPPGYTVPGAAQLVITQLLMHLDD